MNKRKNHSLRVKVTVTEEATMKRYRDHVFDEAPEQFMDEEAYETWYAQNNLILRKRIEPVIPSCASYIGK